MTLHSPLHDERWIAVEQGSPDVLQLSSEILRCYPTLGTIGIRTAYSSVHEMIEVEANGKRYALKLYRPGVRSIEEIRWETDLLCHLAAAGAPVPQIIRGTSGDIGKLQLHGIERIAVLAEWAPGVKPEPIEHTYRLLGRAAGEIHRAADSFESTWARPICDVDTEIYRHLELLRPHLEEIDRWIDIATLGEQVVRYLRSNTLTRGICHRDLTLDNIHTTASEITVFDFDSAGETWRAAEPAGVYQAGVQRNDARWEWWKAGYTEVTSLSLDDIRAVPVFVLMSQFENTAWKLGLTTTSVGNQLDPFELPALVDDWIDWATIQCTDLL